MDEGPRLQRDSLQRLAIASIGVKLSGLPIFASYATEK